MNTERELMQVAMNGEGVIGRRHFLRTIGLGAAGVAASTAIPLSFTDLMALHAAELRKRQMACILLWMAGGPSQFETFDPKPGTDHGGETKLDRDGGPGHLDRRGMVADGQGHERDRPGAVDDQQGGQPSARDLPAPHGLRPVGHDQAPEHRLLRGRRAGPESIRPAAHREHRRRDHRGGLPGGGHGAVRRPERGEAARQHPAQSPSGPVPPPPRPARPARGRGLRDASGAWTESATIAPCTIRRPA